MISFITDCLPFISKNSSLFSLPSVFAQQTCIICYNNNFKNVAGYILDKKSNEDPRCNLFIILEYFFTKY